MTNGDRSVRLVIDPSSERAVYRQLADILRAQIADGQIPAGRLLPSETRLSQEHGVGLGTIRRTLTLLREEGLVVTERGYGTRVVEAQERQQVRVPRGAVLRSRMPTDAERVALGIEAGLVVPVVEIRVGAQVRGPFAADRTDFTTA